MVAQVKQGVCWFRHWQVGGTECARDILWPCELPQSENLHWAPSWSVFLSTYDCGVETDPSLLGFQLTMRCGPAMHSILLQTLGYKGQLCTLHWPSYNRAPIFCHISFLTELTMHTQHSSQYRQSISWAHGVLLKCAAPRNPATAFIARRGASCMTITSHLSYSEDSPVILWLRTIWLHGYLTNQQIQRKYWGHSILSTLLWWPQPPWWDPSLIYDSSYLVAHTISWQTLVQALYHLASHPQYAVTLQEEITSVVGDSGWSKKSIDHLDKLDSFIQETQQVAPLAAGESTPLNIPNIDHYHHSSLLVSIQHLAVDDFTFSNGVHILKGTLIHGPVSPIESDPAICFVPDASNAEQF